MTDDRTTLLPCPFCGGEALKMTSSDGFTSIGCLRCNPLFGVMIQAETEAEAAAAWNTRAEWTCRFKTVERFIGTRRSRADMCECDRCGYRCARGFIHDERFKYCPNCGARIEVES